MSFGEFISGIFSLKMSFVDIGAAIGEFYADFAIKPGATAIFEFFKSGLSGGVALPAFLLILSLFLALFGKRMLSLFRFLFFFALGYVLGISFLAPPIHLALPSLPPVVIGLAAAVVLSVLSKPLYIVSYLLLLELATYVLVGSVFGAGVAAAVIAALVVFVLGVVFKKYVEMLYTSVIGAYLACRSVILFWDFTANLPNPALPVIIITVILGLIATVVQFKTRKRS